MTDLAQPHPALASALAEKGYDQLTPVQEAMLDPAHGLADLLVSAQTGSGKTVAFGLAMAHSLLAEADAIAPAAQPRALVVAPTRELALQVSRELGWLYAGVRARIATCVGGMDFRDERRALAQGAHIVVGTPGRLCDHLGRGTLDAGGLEIVVLDEADEMLDLGFREDLETLLQAAPPARRTLMFSATVSADIARLAATYQRDAQRVATQAARAQHSDIEYRAVLVDAADRENAIVNLLRFHEPRNALVFCATRATVNHLTARFSNRGFRVVALSGELSQAERTHALQAIRDGRAQLCIATDVAARGIDLPGLELVVHADLPMGREALLHRSGRTGRAGARGISALIVPVSQRRRAERLLAGAGVTATWEPAPSAEAVSARDHERLLQDPALTATPTEAEAEAVATLVAGHSPEALALAVLRSYMARRSAPEELRTVGTGPAAPRREFGESVWIALSVGAQQKADPRWILPMLCREAGLDRSAVGAIRIGPRETRVQLRAGSEEQVFAALDAQGCLGDGARVTMSMAPERAAEMPSHAKRAGGPRPAGAPRPAGPRSGGKGGAPGRSPRPHRKGPPRG